MFSSEETRGYPYNFEVSWIGYIYLYRKPFFSNRRLAKLVYFQECGIFKRMPS